MDLPCTTDSIPFKPEHDVRQLIRHRIRQAIELILEEELESALGARRHERTTERSGYRNGKQERLVVTEHGATELTIPRARLIGEDGSSEEWRSELLPRYQRRTAQVDEALLGAYLAGANTRRIRRALHPLLGETSLSKSAISRVVSRLKTYFDQWRERDLSQEHYELLILDGFHLPVRLAKRVVKVPVLAVLGVREDGQKVLVALQIAASESTASWKSIVDDLIRRSLAAPTLVVLDGNKGLCRAVREAWPDVLIQRCTNHKLENLLAKAPKHCHGELKRDYRAITHPASAEAARRAYDSFLRKWSKLVPAVAKSLEEAGEELLTFTRFPKSQWKSLRTTNMLERINGEFRRRTKTQGSFRNEESALILLYGLIAFGQIRLRRIDGWKQMAQFKNVAHAQRAA